MYCKQLNLYTNVTKVKKERKKRLERKLFSSFPCPIKAFNIKTKNNLGLQKMPDLRDLLTIQNKGREDAVLLPTTMVKV